MPNKRGLALALVFLSIGALAAPLSTEPQRLPRQRVHKIDPVAVYETIVTCTLLVKPVWNPNKLPLDIELNGVIGRTIAFGSHSGMLNSGSITSVVGPNSRGEYTVKEIVSALDSTAEETAGVMTNWAGKARLPGAFAGTDWDVLSVFC
ncbi:hypothetical protein D9611_008668 [Ephemerocybe angulata]|uniref:Uncharacterized protein n=1 Tax=Ephemerocybe angulata TaxID=980116 RepID=A0A8H5EVA3_9AGAR|nr:hypothetical protein D9611_008668 [Tulosesus angulatus]